MMPFFERIATLERTRQSFAIATVVGRRSPVSSHLGDRALIFADGQMEGFVGGSCSREIVRRHALATISTRQPMLLQIRPESRSAGEVADGGLTQANAERVIVPMSCSSEGAVDVYIEPRLPLRRLIVVGLTPVADGLARLAEALDYDVVRVVVENELNDLGHVPLARHNPSHMPLAPHDPNHAPLAPPELSVNEDIRSSPIVELRALPQFLAGLDDNARDDIVAIVASQGHYDEIALEALLQWPIHFVALVASRRRAATVAGVLAQQGVPAERIAAIHNPAGLDIGARSAGEVAVSILAQIIALEATAPTAMENFSSEVPAGVTGPAGNAVDPVCGMDVETRDALYVFEHADRSYFFCGAHCRMSFAADPQQYLVTTGAP